MRFRLPGKWELNALSTVAWAVTSLIGRTLRRTVENDGEVERRLRCGEGQLLVTWHGRTLLPLYNYRGKGFVTVISPSRDGEIQYRLYRRFGWEAVRGSTGRGAAQAALGAIRHLRSGATLAIAPDGPKGPSGVVQPGTLYLARKSGCPIVPAGVSAAPAWILKSWDRFLVPKPFARAAIVFGEPVYVPADASDAWLSETATALGQAMDVLQARADHLVGLPGAPALPAHDPAPPEALAR